jgi:YqjK-like protein
MNKQLVELACRRRLLLEKIRTQRMEVVEISMHWQKPLALADAGIKAVHFIRRHPALMTGCLALLMALRRGDFAGLKQQGWRLLCLYPATAYLSQQLPCLKRNPEVEP